MHVKKTNKQKNDEQKLHDNKTDSSSNAAPILLKTLNLIIAHSSDVICELTKIIMIADMTL